MHCKKNILLNHPSHSAMQRTRPSKKKNPTWIFFLLNVYIIYMGVSKNRGIPKWMVKIMENHWGVTIIFGNIHIIPQNFICSLAQPPTTCDHLLREFSSKTWPLFVTARLAVRLRPEVFSPSNLSQRGGKRPLR